MTRCACEICRYGDEYHRNLERVPDDVRPFFADAYEKHCMTDVDRDYYRCIVMGQWPNSHGLSFYRRLVLVLLGIRPDTRQVPKECEEL